MLTLILSALLTLIQSPERSMATPLEFNRLDVYNGQLYFAPYLGANLYFYRNDSFKTLTFGDDPLFIIEEFRMAPFFLYLSDGQSVIKYYLQQSLSESVYAGNNIAGFCLLESGDIAIIDRRPNRVLIIDRQAQIRISLTDFPAKDICANDDRILILTKDELIFSDHHLNFLNRIPLPQTMARVIIAGDQPILFSPGRSYIYIYNQTWRRIDLEIDIKDIAADQDSLFILEDYGNTVSVYSISDN